MTTQDVRTCLVTGGSRGIGRAITCALAARGERVFFTYEKNEGDAETTLAQCADLPGTVSALRGSVADSDHVRDVVKTVMAETGRIDVLVNNAGRNQMYPLALIEEKDWDEVMNVNVKGAFLFSRAVARHMIKRRSGHILNMGSFASERIIETPVHYAAAKSALRGLTEALALELGRYNIIVNLLGPSVLDAGLSSMLPQHRLNTFLAQCPAGRVSTADEVAELAVFMTDAENTFMTGAKIVFDGGL